MNKNKRMGSVGFMGLVTVLGGCGYGSVPPKIVQGRQFSFESAKSIDQGMTAIRVRQILGDPLEIQPLTSGERWHYFAREEKDEVVYILGLIPKRDVRSIRDYDLSLRLKNQIVASVRYRESAVP
jgi:outer membrane protein assembly factor BamE (lipoprotein component of BamABCDE complex)